METFLFDVLFFCFEIIKAILCVYFFASIIVLGLIISIVVILILRFRKKRNITYRDFF